MTRKARKARVGKAAATKKFPKRNASAVAKGAAYAVLAGRPSKQAVIAVFGKTGYALSWVARADRLGITPNGTQRLKPLEICMKVSASSPSPVVVLRRPVQF